MEFAGDIATIQRRLAATSDLHRRRLAVLDAIAIQSGESILDVGCGGGALLPLLTAAAGAKGRVVGIDTSADQVAAAHRLCAELDIVETAVLDVNKLTYEDASFDAIIAVQVIEYLEAPATALLELRRICSSHGRLVIVATNWDTMFWNSTGMELTARLQAAWRKHAPHPNLPAELRPLLESAGFRMIRQAPLTIINNVFHEDTFAYWAAQLIAAFGVTRNLVPQSDADAWLEELKEAALAGRFFFSSTPVLTRAVAA